MGGSCPFGYDMKFHVMLPNLCLTWFTNNWFLDLIAVMLLLEDSKFLEFKKKCWSWINSSIDLNLAKICCYCKGSIMMLQRRLHPTKQTASSTIFCRLLRALLTTFAFGTMIVGTYKANTFCVLGPFWGVASMCQWGLCSGLDSWNRERRWLCSWAKL